MTLSGHFSKLLLRILFIIPFFLKAQDSFRTGVSGFYVPEKNSLNIGFTSFDLHCPLAVNDKIKIDYGLRFIGASAGRRGGYFAFGYFGDLLLRPNRIFQPGIHLAFLAGGGAAAPDNDGWMLQGIVFSQFRFRNGLAFRAGLNYAYVSGGIIQGFSPALGMNWNLRTGINDSISSVWLAAYGEGGLAKYGPKQLGLIGAGTKLKAGRFFSGDLTIHAITNTHGGYMQILFSGGPDFQLGKFHFSPAAMLGLGGGGGARTGGGGLYGAQAGIYYLGNRFYTGIKYQVVRTVAKSLEYEGWLFSLGKTLQTGSEEKFRPDLVSKTYAGRGGFSNIGARFPALEHKHLKVLGTTYWAFTHQMGAYAEGLFEIILQPSAKVPVYLVAAAGAGAGSGINERSAALIYAAGLGIRSPWKRIPTSLEFSYWRGGNIPALSISFCYHLNNQMQERSPAH